MPYGLFSGFGSSFALLLTKDKLDVNIKIVTSLKGQGLILNELEREFGTSFRTFVSSFPSLLKSSSSPFKETRARFECFLSSNNKKNAH